METVKKERLVPSLHFEREENQCGGNHSKRNFCLRNEDKGEVDLPLLDQTVVSEEWD